VSVEWQAVAPYSGGDGEQQQQGPPPQGGTEFTITVEEGPVGVL